MFLIDDMLAWVVKGRTSLIPIGCSDFRGTGLQNDEIAHRNNDKS
jgi:hypothetical protein